MLIHNNFIEHSLKEAIEAKGLLKVGINLNDYFSFEKANEYTATYLRILQNAI